MRKRQYEDTPSKEERILEITNLIAVPVNDLIVLRTMTRPQLITVANLLRLI